MPSVVPAGATLVASGRQALNLVAQELRSRGVRTLLAPGYYCTTMLLPFQLEGIQVRTLPVDATYLLDPAPLAEQLRQLAGTGPSPSRVGAPGVAVLHAETFGTRAGPRLVHTLAQARQAGVSVIVDQTHTALSAGESRAGGDQTGRDRIGGDQTGDSRAGEVVADYRVASLRKLLPVPEGGWVTGLAAPPALPRRPVDEQVVQLRLAGASEQAELAMDDAFEPGAPSASTYQLVAATDVDALVARRRANATSLRMLLDRLGMDVVNAPDSLCCVVVRRGDAELLRARLAEVGVHAPVYWPRPAGLAAGAAWPQDVLCLPVDHPLPRQAQQVLVGASR